MLIPLSSLIEKYGIIFKGILHVGAHQCEEITEYEQHISRKNVLWVEAIPSLVDYCRSTYPNLNIENAIVSDVIESVSFNIANNGQSSSLLDFGIHKHYHPDIHYVNTISGTTELLSNIIRKYDTHFNFLNLDIQGAELKALRGMGQYLSKVDYIYTEVNSDDVYKGCCLVSEIDEYLLHFGLFRVETSWTPNKWGDAFYMRI